MNKHRDLDKQVRSCLKEYPETRESFLGFNIR